MNCFALFGLILSVVTYACGYYYPVYNLNDAPQLFAKFVVEYHRNYKDVYDTVIHYDAFKRSLAQINKFNDRPHSPSEATFDINQFADYTEEEMNQMHGLLPE